nr:TfoX/Sxy family protein [Microbacterium lemovicicum]
MAAKTPKALDERTRALLDRIEAHLPAGDLREAAMFGTHAVMLDEVMVIAVRKDHSLLVRVDADDDAALVARPEASRPDMGPRRSMGVGWIQVDAASLDDDGVIDFWVGQARRRFERHGPGTQPTA